MAFDDANDWYEKYTSIDFHDSTSNGMIIQMIMDQVKPFVLQDGKDDQDFLTDSIVQAYYERCNCLIGPTIKLIKDVLSWRQENGINDKSYFEGSKDSMQRWGSYICGPDDYGKQMLVIKPALWPETLDEVQKFRQFHLSLLFRIEEECLKKKIGYTCIIDLSGFKATDSSSEILLHLLKEYFHYFPVKLEKVIYFKYFWYLKPLLAAVFDSCPPKLRENIEYEKVKELNEQIKNAMACPIIL